MPEHESKTLVLEDVKIIFRNFAGIEREFNAEGERNFSVVLPPELAKKMLDDGWRVKQLKPRGEDEEEGDYHIKVKVNYKKGRPPRVVMVSSRGRTDLGADEVDILDYAEIKQCDVVLNGWWSDMAGGGYSAFLKSIFITINEDELDLKYASLPDADQNPSVDRADPPWDVEEAS